MEAILIDQSIDYTAGPRHKPVKHWPISLKYFEENCIHTDPKIYFKNLLKLYIPKISGPDWWCIKLSHPKTLVKATNKVKFFNGGLISIRIKVYNKRAH